MPIGTTIEPQQEPMPDGKFGGTATATNSADGRFHFGSIEFTQPGVYWYQITEAISGGTAIQQGVGVYGAMITVEKIGDTDELKATVQYFRGDFNHPEFLDPGQLPTFTNIETKPVKTEPDPGPDMPVKVGDVITYRVTWYNDDEAGKEQYTVHVRDRLDPGLTYVEGTAKAYRGDAPDETPTPDTAEPVVEGTLTSTEGADTLNWVITDSYPGDHGYVEFQARVNEKARSDWDYNGGANRTDAPTGPSDVNKSADDDWLVHNQAGVKVGNQDWEWTEKIDNPTEPEKSADPPSGSGVKVGDTITYRITWRNHLKDAAQITVTDVLDPGVTYIAGSARACTGTYPNGTDISADITKNGEYTQESRTLTWDLGSQAPGEFGYVEFKVYVNENARLDDSAVENDARVRVGNHSFQTNEVEHYLNGQLTVAKLVSGDGADPDQDFTFTVTLTKPAAADAQDSWAQWDGSCTCTREDGSAQALAFAPNGDRSAYTATFTLRHGQSVTIGGLPLGAGYTVAETDVSGYTSSSVNSTGSVTAQDPPRAVFTNTKTTNTPPPGPKDTPAPSTPVSTPTATPTSSTTPTPSTSPSPSPTPDGQPHKVETDPGDGQMVVPDQWVTYEITWENTHAESATVTIWDTLDPNVEFVSASEGYTYDPATHTVTWVLPDRAGGSTGSVTVTVRVLPSAVQAGIIRNQAHVQVGDDPAQDTEIPENPLTPPSPSPVAPSPTPSSGIPDTGDSSRPGLWLALLTVSLMGLGLIGGATLRRRKRSK